MSEVVVVGDVLLDRDLDGSASRLCPDAPVPVVDEPGERLRPGGAGLAALLLSHAGCSVTLIAAFADDEAGSALRGLLADAGVRLAALPLVGTTPEKVRIRADAQPLVRLDRGSGAPRCDPHDPTAAAALASAEAILVADYGQGLTAQPLIRDELSRAARTRPLVWDPHPRSQPPVAGARLVTPNEDEARHWAGPTGDGLAGVSDAGLELLRRWQAGAVCITRGGDGAVLVTGDGTPLAVPTPSLPTDAVDTCGAGDRFAAEAASQLAAGATPSEAVVASVRAAAEFVATGSVSGIASPGHPSACSVPVPPAHADEPAAAGDVVERVRAAGGTIVATGGCFDLLHAGHVRTLQAARALGDCLVVCLNSDASVRRLKGGDRPLMSEQDRRAVLLGLDAVDAVVTFEEATPAATLEQLRPDVWTKGADYTVTDLPEAHQLARWGGQALVVPYLTGRSTSGLIDTVRNQRTPTLTEERQR